MSVGGRVWRVVGFCVGSAVRFRVGMSVGGRVWRTVGLIVGILVGSGVGEGVH